MHRCSESIGTIAGALAKAQAELVNPEKSLSGTITGAAGTCGVVAGCPPFTVTGSHPYGMAGSFPVKVSIVDDAPSGTSGASVTTTAVVT